MSNPIGQKYESASVGLTKEALSQTTTYYKSASKQLDAIHNKPVKERVDENDKDEWKKNDFSLIEPKAGANGSMVFLTHGGGKMRYNQRGNVGISVSVNPKSILEWARDIEAQIKRNGQGEYKRLTLTPVKGRLEFGALQGDKLTVKTVGLRAQIEELTKRAEAEELLAYRTAQSNKAKAVSEPEPTEAELTVKDANAEIALAEAKLATRHQAEAGRHDPMLEVEAQASAEVYGGERM